MTYTLTHDETGRVSTFASEAECDRAMAWYNATSKEDLIAWYVEWDNRVHAAPLGEIWADPDCTKLAPDWADIIMAAYAADTVGDVA